MANPEHLKILKKGVVAWNKWRFIDQSIKPDLEGTDLRHMRLEHINLNETNLMSANLSGVLLNNAALVSAKLMNAKLVKTNFTGAYLQEANLEGAELSGAKFKEANLIGATLNKANMESASFLLANLMYANCVCSNLQGALLVYSRLIGANLAKAILTGAKLYGTARDNWIIKDVKCKFVYWDAEGKQRSPKDRDLEPGEFERLYAALPTIEYIFEQEMTPLDPLIMDRVVQAIREKRPEFDIKIDSINARGLAPSIKFTVQHEDHKEPALEEVRKLYEERVKRLEADKDRLYDLFALAMEDIICKGRLLEQKDKLLAETIAYAKELQKVVSKEPEKSFTKVAKRKALDIIGGAIEDFAKGQVKEAAKEIIKLGKDLGPIIVQTAAYTFFKSMTK